MLELLICRICGNIDGNNIVTAREMLFGTYEHFDYLECSYCGCLQIATIPKDMSKYYSARYFSAKSKRNRIKLKGLLESAMVKSNKFLSKKIFPTYVLSAVGQPFILGLIRDFHLKSDSRILDVGCGRGDFIMRLIDMGFKNVLGLEPFFEGKVRDDLRIINGTIDNLPLGMKFDAVILNHSFEHMPDQISTLAKISSIISEQGLCQIRIPLKTDYIWKRFGTDWVQLDAPRHFYLHTLYSFIMSARKAGLEVRSVVFDSTAFQFWGSEQCLRNIPLRNENSYEINPEKSVFDQDQIRRFSRIAKRLNKDCQGDQATFYLSKKLCLNDRN